MRASDDSHFDASGPVGRYWLCNGVGFAVCGGDGRKLGVVVHVVVDRRRQVAERLIVRRPGLVRRPRYVAVDPRAVESVCPDARRLLVEAAVEGATPATRRPARTRACAAAGSARAGVHAFGRATGPVVTALDRRLAVAVAAALRLSRRGADAVAEAADQASERTRREAPRARLWIAARANEAGRIASTMLRFLQVAARRTARLLVELAVLAAVLAVDTWKRAAARLRQPDEEPERRQPERLPVERREWRRDADAPLVRERRAETSRRSDRRARRR